MSEPVHPKPLPMLFRDIRDGARFVGHGVHGNHTVYEKYGDFEAFPIGELVVEGAPTVVLAAEAGSALNFASEAEYPVVSPAWTVRPAP